MRHLKLILAVFVLSMQLNIQAKTQVQLKPEPGLMTETIQKAIDLCAEKGGGAVVFLAGKYLSGGIELKSKVSLKFEKGTILQGSDKYADYRNDAFIFGKDLSDISIAGEGTIDGVDCINKQGEEGFRGPHCIRLVNCKHISLEGFTIKNSANWAINCRHCSFGKVDKVSIRGGHDGLHTRFCNDFTVTNCDFRTGDDAFAGNDNRNISVTNCQINTSCNGFRMGCMNLTVKHCHFWGPCEAVHRISKRKNMLSAFVHFSPEDENPKLESGNWLIEDITVENVDQFYVYNFRDGLWQTGQPATSLHFRNIKARGILGAFNIVGDSGSKFKLKVENSSFSFREGAEYKGESFEGKKLLSPALFNATSFGDIELRKVTLSKKGDALLLNCSSGKTVILNSLRFISGMSTEPYSIEQVGNLIINQKIHQP